jgi:DNA-binding NarL/FixJ family response regulator
MSISSTSDNFKKRPRVTTAKRYGVFIVEDHPLTRTALAALVNLEDDFYICGEADNEIDALARIAKLEPAAVVADITLRSGNGIDLMKKLMLLCPGVPILAVSGQDENVFAVKAIHAGARGYLTKGSGGEKLVPALRTILAGDIYLNDTLKEQRGR